MGSNTFQKKESKSGYPIKSFEVTLIKKNPDELIISSFPPFCLRFFIRSVSIIIWPTVPLWHQQISYTKLYTCRNTSTGYSSTTTGTLQSGQGSPNQVVGGYWSSLGTNRNSIICLKVRLYQVSMMLFA